MVSRTRVAVWQFAPVFGAVEENLKRLESAAAPHEFDLLVLPELFATGDQFRDRQEAARLAESADDGPTRRALERLARKKDACVVAGFAERAGESLFNSAMLVTRDGLRAVYRKIHLFDREKEIFDSGAAAAPVVEVCGARLGLMICFDWIFPESARSLAIRGAHILCHPANLVLPYCQRAMFARAVENRVFVVTANRTGVEDRLGGSRLRFTGGSQALDPDGRTLFSLGEEEAFATVEVEPERAARKEITGRNHLFDDRRPHLYPGVCDEWDETKA